MQKILFVGNDLAFFFSHRLPLAKQALRAGYQVHIAMPEGREHPLVDSLRILGMHYHPVAIRRMGRNPWHELTAVFSLYRLYRAERPDLIHHIAMKAILYGGLASLFQHSGQSLFAFTGLGTLFTHEDRGTRLLRQVLEPLYRLIFLPVRAWALFQNPDDLNLFLGSGITSRQRSFLIRGSGVNLQDYQPVPEPEGVPVVMLASRLLRTKGVDEFAGAAALIAACGIRARFVLVGDCPDNHDAVPEVRVREWVRRGQLEWWGYCSDMPAILVRASIVCLPAHYREGVPKVLLEAAACGRALVASDIPGNREVVQDGDNGLLVRPRDEHALAAAIATLLADPERRASMGRNGRRLVEREFSVEQVVGKTLAIYRQLLTP
ncbi:MAG TPA: glycosyltransferase family 4 protein [Thiolinea sp.]|nr:glycosyltransferase family 4 protein [Thiolinea sp.]